MARTTVIFSGLDWIFPEGKIRRIRGGNPVRSPAANLAVICSPLAARQADELCNQSRMSDRKNKAATIVSDGKGSFVPVCCPNLTG